MDIDVSKYNNCLYWNYGDCLNENINNTDIHCLAHKNCLYKKLFDELQQLKAENEELKETVKVLKQILREENKNV